MPDRFSLFLKLTPLGNLRIDFLVQDQSLYLRFNTDSKEVSNFIANSKDEMERSITGAHIVGISYTENAEDPFSALIKNSRANTASLFDTKA